MGYKATEDKSWQISTNKASREVLKVNHQSKPLQNDFSDGGRQYKLYLV